MSVNQTRALLEAHGLAPNRALGQNFLHDEDLAAKLVRRAGVGPDDAVLEIGAGLGILTRALALRSRRVRSIEIDAGLVRALLEGERALPGNVELLHADALELDLQQVCAELGTPLRVVANLPYATAAPLLRRVLDIATQLEGFALMLQREVAERIGSKHGCRSYTSLSVLCQWVATVDELFHLHARCFHPVPRVVSSFVMLRPRAPRLLEARELPGLERIVRAGFTHRRKTLPNALARAAGYKNALTAEVLTQLGHDPRVRAEHLPPEAWLTLARTLRDANASRPA